MARLFISHSSANNGAAVALGQWLKEQGFDDVFLDIDPQGGLHPGERWQDALKAAEDQCEAVLFLISPAWLASNWCLREFLLAKSLHKRIFGLLIEGVALERLPAEVTEWQLCELGGNDHMRGFDVAVSGASQQVMFAEAGLDRLRRGLARAGVDAKSFPWPPPDEPNRAPYRGFKALEPQDAAIFFGRDAAIVRGIDRVRGVAERGIEKLFVVLGASGSGKSSFIRAGLWPRLLRDDTNFLPLPPIRPQTAVVTGSTGLAVALAAAFARLDAPRASGAIAATLAQGGGAFGGLLDDLLAAARQRLAAIGENQADPAIVLPLDQAEELFDPDGAAEAQVFLKLMADQLLPTEGKQERRLLVIATIRSDRYEALQNEPNFLPVKRYLFDLPPLPPTEFKSAIDGPAQRVRQAGGTLEIDPALVERLVTDAQDADALPLLAFTMERLFSDYGAGGKLTVEQYEHLGGLRGSIEEAVTAALAGPDRAPAIPAENDAQLAALRAAFIPWLARVDPETDMPMRRVAHVEEIPADSRAVVERLVSARLLVADRRSGVDVVEVAHESLLRQWPALAAWLDADADDLKSVEGIESAAGQWARNGEAEAWLDHRGERLAEAERLLARAEFRQRIGDSGARYLAACRAREDAERKEKEDAVAREQARLAEITKAQSRTARLQRQTRWGLAAVALIIVAGLGLGWWQIDLRQHALNDARTAIMGDLAEVERLRSDLDGSLRFALRGQQIEMDSGLPEAELATVMSRIGGDVVSTVNSMEAIDAQYSPDGFRIVTTSRSATDHIATVRVWDAATGNQIAVMRGNESSVSSAAFSFDGSRIVTTSWEGTASIWDAATGNKIVVLRGHEDIVTSAAFSPDGKRIVTASLDKTARIWDATSGKEIRILLWHEAGVVSAAFSSDGDRVVTAAEDQTARLWNTATGQQITVFHSPRGRMLVAQHSAIGPLAVTAIAGGVVLVWDVATGHLISALAGHTKTVESAQFSPDRTRIVTKSSPENNMRVWDVKTGQQLGSLSGFSTIRIGGAGVSPNGELAFVPTLHGALIFHFRRNEISVLQGHKDTVFCASFSRDGKLIVTGSRDKTARVWNALTGWEIAVLPHGDAVTAATFSPNGTQVVTLSGNNTVRIWDVADGLTVAQLATTDAISVAFGANGRNIIVTDRKGVRREWNTDTREIVSTSTGLPPFVHFSHDGMYVVGVNSDPELGDGIVKIGNVRTMKATGSIHHGWVNSAEFSNDGRRIVTASDDQTARVWDLAGREIMILQGHENTVFSASFSPDGSRVVTASQDNTARIWDVHFATMPTKDLVGEACHRLDGISTMTGDEMRLAGYPDTMKLIDVCDGVSAAPALSSK